MRRVKIDDGVHTSRSSGPRHAGRSPGPVWSRRAFLAACGPLLCWGCGPRQPSASNQGAASLQLNWIPDAQHGGFYAAETLELFSQHGLDCRIEPGGPGVDGIPKLVLGQVDFAVANADQVLLARAQQAEVVAVFAALQQSPRCIMVHDETGIRGFDDLQNMTLALGEGKAFAEFLKQNLPLTNVRIVPYAGDISKWLTDPSYGQQGYVFSEPLLAKKQGARPKVLMVSDLGFNPYSSVVVARRRTLDERPDFVRAFVRSLRAGWLAYLNQPDETNRHIHRINSTMQWELLQQAAAAIDPLCTDGLASRDMLGTMTEQRWSELHAQLFDLKLLDRPEPDIGQVFANVV